MNNFRFSPGAYVADQDLPLRNVGHRGQPNTQVQTWMNYKNQGIWPHRWEIVCWGGLADGSTGMSPTRSQYNALISGGAFQHYGATSSDGDSVFWYLPCDAGTWALMSMWTRDTGRGRFNVTFGSTLIASQWDNYGSLAYNQVTLWTGIPITAPGVHELRFTCDGKNSSSSDYDLVIQLLSLVRTGK